MNILLIGSGGRENALAYKLRASKSTNELYILPGNPGTEIYGKNISIQEDNDSVLEFCRINMIDLVIIGPEKPLVNGLGNYLRNNGIYVFGPDSGAAQIESSKSYSKSLMDKYKVPTASYKEFKSSEFEQAKEFLERSSYPIVIKANGLAAGKGVFICYDFNEAINAVNEIFINNIFGDSGNKIIIEEFMEGEEASIFAITDGKDFILLPAAQDHKRIGDNDTGKNTGGMGAYAPAPIITSELSDRIAKEIISPIIKGLKSEGNTFIGCLYAGLMITKEGPRVVEFNCRFGDPETQVVLPILNGDLAELLFSAASGSLKKNIISYNGGSALCIVAVSEGYPDSYKSGYEITGLSNNTGVLIFHAGTKKENDKIFSNGGRVLGVTSFIKDNDLQKAKSDAYIAINQIYFNNMYYRKDIGDKAFKYLKGDREKLCS